MNMALPTGTQFRLMHHDAANQNRKRSFVEDVFVDDRDVQSCDSDRETVQSPGSVSGWGSPTKRHVYSAPTRRRRHDEMSSSDFNVGFSTIKEVANEEESDYLSKRPRTVWTNDTSTAAAKDVDLGSTSFADGGSESSTCTVAGSVGNIDDCNDVDGYAFSTATSGSTASQVGSRGIVYSHEGSYSGSVEFNGGGDNKVGMDDKDVDVVDIDTSSCVRVGHDGSQLLLSPTNAHQLKLLRSSLMPRIWPRCDDTTANYEMDFDSQSPQAKQWSLIRTYPPHFLPRAPMVTTGMPTSQPTIPFQRTMPVSRVLIEEIDSADDEVIGDDCDDVAAGVDKMDMSDD